MKNYAKQQLLSLEMQEDIELKINMRYMIMRVNLVYCCNCNCNANELSQRNLALRFVPYANFDIIHSLRND